ncbi:hypothetical protein [Actinoplanes sp. HUAS TT8]|uniref:hypothetical protein n=1 Tax=Actinoplanes sp. HUAS TT8 TaxID=3447453 RepID=UPI003F520E5D
MSRSAHPLLPDGLVECRDEVIDTGLARLIGSVRAENAEKARATVMAGTGTESPGDDITVLAVRRNS